MKLYTSITVIVSAMTRFGLGTTNAENLGSIDNEDQDFSKPRGYLTIMKSHDNKHSEFYPRLISGEKKTKFKRKCLLELNDEGDLVTYRRKPNGSYVKQWQSGSHDSGRGNYITSLQRDGNFVTRNADTGEAVWSTRSQNPDERDWVCGEHQYHLYFTSECRLSLWKHRPGCPIDENSYYSQSSGPWWGNVHGIEGRNIYRWYSPMYYVLQKGEIAYGLGPGGDYSMMLDQSCNLIVFEGSTLPKNKNKITWSSEDDGADPMDHPSGDCHLFARTINPEDSTGQGEFVLYGGAYQRSINNSYEDRGRRYWSRPVTCMRPEDGAYNVAISSDGPHGFHMTCFNGHGFDW